MRTLFGGERRAARFTLAALLSVVVLALTALQLRRTGATTLTDAAFVAVNLGIVPFAFMLAGAVREASRREAIIAALFYAGWIGSAMLLQVLL